MSKCAVCGTEEVVVFTKAYCPREDSHLDKPRTWVESELQAKVQAMLGTIVGGIATLPNYWGKVPSGLVSKGTHPDQCSHTEDLYLAPAGTGPGWFCYHCGTLMSSTVVSSQAGDFAGYHDAWDEYLDHYAPFHP